MDLFGRARKAMGGWSPPPPSKPHYFRVYCPDGHLIEGQRTESYQALRCPDCGEGVFVLPRSPLPEPKTPVHRSTRPTRAVSPDDSPIALTDPLPFSHPEGEVEVEPEADQIEWVDEETEGEPVPPVQPRQNAPIAEFDPDLHLDEPDPTAGAVTRPGKTSKYAASRPRLKPQPELQTPVRVRVPITQRIGKYKNALILVGVILVVTVAVGTRLWRQKREELPKIYERGKTEGLLALDQGNFPVAKELLREASQAVRLLGSGFNDEKVNEVIHGADEAAIFADLASVTLDELVEKRARSKSAEEWKSLFDSSYRGQSFLIQAHLTAVPDTKQPDSTYELDYRIGYGVGPIPAGRGRISLRGFKLFENARPKVGDLLVFGARLASVELDQGRGDWLVSLEPESGVFIHHIAALQSLNWLQADEGGEESP